MTDKRGLVFDVANYKRHIKLNKDKINELKEENKLIQAKIIDIYKNTQPCYYIIKCVSDKMEDRVIRVGLFSTIDIAYSYLPTNRKSYRRSDNTTWEYFIEVIFSDQVDENRFGLLDAKPDNFPFK
jgi:hypothetical protein